MLESNWSGMLTVSNIQKVADSISELLEGKRFTSVTGYERRGGFVPVVRAGMQLAFVRVDIGEEGRSAGFNIMDTVSDWGCHTNLEADEELDLTLQNPHVSFRKDEQGGDRVVIIHRESPGDKTYWIAVVEPN